MARRHEGPRHHQERAALLSPASGFSAGCWRIERRHSLPASLQSHERPLGIKAPGLSGPCLCSTKPHHQETQIEPFHRGKEPERELSCRPPPYPSKPSELFGAKIHHLEVRYAESQARLCAPHNWVATVGR